ncbi:MAG: hypothetical protein IJ211_08035 [Campylobacter sp.]|nr:hypothetical protein [Campylobacter sp.]MBQ9293192.1 hypothetical protein [Campylobacter sp.]MBQ9875709.1 hypothetical protein [Campylobacter sp.]MBR0071014.1 hypothetical protein [Campylobacter sp.]
MKLAKLVLASSLVASCAFAEGVFVGVVGGYDYTYKLSGEGADEELDGKNPVIGIKAGYDFGAFRAYGQYNYKIKSTYDESNFQGYEEKTEISAHELLIGADWTPSLNENLKLAVGPYIGYSRLDIKDKGVWVTNSASGGLVVTRPYDDKYSINGFLVGAKLGIIYNLGVGEFEAGIKTDYAWYKETSEVVAIDTGTVGGYIGYNFKF